MVNNDKSLRKCKKVGIKGTMKITALKYGESVFEENYIFKGGNKDKLLPISFVIYLIQTERKNILVDVGCDDGAGFEMSIFKKPVDILKEYGLDPKDITDVVITHAHHDHIEAIRYYENATIHIQRDEYPKAKKYITNGFAVHLIDDEFALTERVTVKKIGGHSTGSCIVVADNFVLCGDECYYEKCLTDGIMTGVFCNEENSLQFLTVYSDEKYVPLLFHDPQILAGSVGDKTIFNK